jgi:hypothetical protein
MLVESLVKVMVELQGFRVVRVTGDVAGLTTESPPDGRYAPRGGTGPLPRHASSTALSERPVVGQSGDARLRAAAIPVCTTTGACTRRSRT